MALLYIRYPVTGSHISISKSTCFTRCVRGADCVAMTDNHLQKDVEERRRRTILDHGDTYVLYLQVPQLP
jgi:hypothetical protein